MAGLGEISFRLTKIRVELILSDIPRRQTAFGIMLGTVSSLIFQRVPDKPGITGLNWR